MNKLVFQFPSSAAPFQCPLAPFTQQLSPAFGRIADVEFFPEGLFFSSKVKASSFFNASVETLDRWIAKGLITPYKRGRVYFFPIAGLAQAMNNPLISEFLKKKAITQKSAKKGKSQNVTRVKYWMIPKGKSMFVCIRYRGVNIVWLCDPSFATDRKELEGFISDVIRLYVKCQTLDSSSYERN
jgi:hypothetical protein